MQEDFAARFGRAPAGIVRAPGRVNLMGEHVDYHDLPVLPMALQRAVRVAFAPRGDDAVEVVNQSSRYGERRFRLAPPFQVGPPGDWGNYLLAAATVAHERGARRGADLFVVSDLPTAAGLSSSSALVVAVALALLAASGEEVQPVELAEALARGERFVGTAGGGMDQAVCLGARRGAALRVDFHPLRWEPVPLPPGWRIVVAHSGVTAEKSGAAQAAYNERRADGEKARTRVAKSQGTPGASYRQLLDEVGPARLLEVGGRVLAPRVFRRFRHVVTEAGRVEAAVGRMAAADAPGFGALLLASHASLREDCQVSHPRLDALVDAACSAGAHGARLTGAGFGGCMLALTDRECCRAVEAALGRTLAEAGVPEREQTVFQVVPGAGARIRMAGSRA